MEYATEFDPTTFPAREGAIYTLDVVEKNGKLDLLGSLLDDVFGEDGMPTAAQVNDFLWFEQEAIFKSLGIEEDGNDALKKMGFGTHCAVG